jgi:2OG-Fe(II) oxygenase superfamily
LNVQDSRLANLQWPDFDADARPDIAGLSAAYRHASPFSHLVVDDLFPPQALRAIEDEFEAPDSGGWREYRGALQRKRGTGPNAPLPPAAQAYFNFLYSGPFIRFLTRLTGIEDLIPDPALYGGGMHEVAAGGSFEMHVDFEYHPRTRLTNRLAVITYLNHDWTAEDGGVLELWDVDPSKKGVSVLPAFGRTIIMEQSARAAHGLPQPVREGRSRRSIIAYFYTNGLVTERSNDTLKTTYIPHSGQSSRQRLEIYLRRVTPPMVITALKAIDSRLRAR